MTAHLHGWAMPHEVGGPNWRVTAMAGQLFLQNVIAIIWDFDKTLIPGYMQTPLFKHFRVEEARFWAEVNALPEHYRRLGVHRVSNDSIYLNHILTYVQARIFAGLTNALLRKLGAELEFYPGLPEFFEAAREEARSKLEYIKHEIAVEHYIVSTGLREMIRGSKLNPYVDDIWACEFVEGCPQPGFLDNQQGSLPDGEAVITDIAYAIDNTSKTRAVFEINKGTNKFSTIDVNASFGLTDRRVPFQNMIYIADGPSDVPVFSIIKQYGGLPLAVYKPRSEREFEQAYNLQQQGRVQSFGEANYIAGSHTYMLIINGIRRIADRIVYDREDAIGDKTGKPPEQFLE